MKFLRNILDNIEPQFTGDGKFKKFYPMYEMVDTFLFTPSTQTKNAPYVRDSIDLKRSMVFVVLALLPCFLFGIYNVAHQIMPEADLMTKVIQGSLVVLPIYAVVFAVGGICELLFAIIRGHEINEGFLVTGFLIPLCLPPTIPLWMVAVATVFGVVIGKEIFGGTGYNVFNPALLARAFLFFSYPVYMSGDKVWTADGISQATPLLSASSNSLDPASPFYGVSWLDAFLGFIPGSIGETSTLAILIGALFLILTGIASSRVMIFTFAGMVFTSTLLNFIGSETNAMFGIPPHWHFVMGGFAFGMVFMATDPVSSAQTDQGRMYYGLLIGFMAVIIRCINPAYPEGMMLAILFANAFAPLFDYYAVQKNIERRKNGYK
jgi:Na+-transporting NADH:ubiquinone oxidoreductase subunit B